MTTPVLVLHGGAGVLAQRSYDREIDHLTALAERTRDALLAGLVYAWISDLDVAESIRFAQATSSLAIGEKSNVGESLSVDRVVASL